MTKSTELKKIREIENSNVETATRFIYDEIIAMETDKVSIYIEQDYSNSSDSRYLKITLEGDFENEDDDSSIVNKKVRISNHPLPPTYGKTMGWADYDVGIGYYNPDVVGVLEFFDSFSAHFNISPSPEIASAIDEFVKEQEEKEKKELDDHNENYARRHIYRAIESKWMNFCQRIEDSIGGFAGCKSARRRKRRKMMEYIESDILSRARVFADQWRGKKIERAQEYRLRDEFFNEIFSEIEERAKTYIEGKFPNMPK